MRISHPTLTQGPALKAQANSAFTLAEMMLASGIFSMLVAGLVSAQVFGLKMYVISDAKMTVGADARRVLNNVRDEIRGGKLLYVGNGDNHSFNLLPDNSPRIGNALRVCATTDTNSYVYYYVDTNQCCLSRMVSSNSLVTVIARNVTNQFAFRAEDFQGNALTNYVNNRVINMTLQVLESGWGGTMGQFYQLQTRIARRAIE